MPDEKPELPHDDEQDEQKAPSGWEGAPAPKPPGQ